MNPFSSRFLRADQNQYRFAVDPEGDQDQRKRFYAKMEQALQITRKLAIVGRHGTGKSTLLETLRCRLENRFTETVWLKLDSERSRTRTAVRDLILRLRSHSKSSPPCIVIDGYEQLRWLDRVTVNRETGRITACLLISSHTEQRGFVTIHRTGWNTEIATQLTLEKLCDMPSEVQSKLLNSFLLKLNDRRNQELNLRELWFLMYDDAERLRRVQPAHPFSPAPTCDACSS